MTAESNYLDAIEALEEDNRERALEHARKAVKIDPEHVDAWRVISDASLPGLRLQPTLKQAAQSLAAAKKVVALQPDDLGMWVRGGRLLSDELGLYMDHMKGIRKKIGTSGKNDLRANPNAPADIFSVDYWKNVPSST